MNRQGNLCRFQPVSFMRPAIYIALVSGVLLTTGCSHLPFFDAKTDRTTSGPIRSKQPKPDPDQYAKYSRALQLPRQQTYVAAGRVFSVDLSAPVFRTRQTLTHVCTPEAVKLDMTDQLLNQYRVEWLNLARLPALAADSPAARLDKLARYYQQQVYTGSQVISEQPVSTIQGAGRYLMLQRTGNSGAMVGLLLTAQDSTAMALQYAPQARPDAVLMRQDLRALAAAVRMPAAAGAGQQVSDQPDILPAAASAAQRRAWLSRYAC